CNVASELRRRSLQLRRRLLRERALLRRLDALLLDVSHQDPAAGDLGGRHVAQGRFGLDLAFVDDEWAAWMKLATRRRMGEVRGQPLDRDKPVLAGLVDARDRTQQRPRVRVLRALEDLLDRSLFDDPAG